MGRKFIPYLRGRGVLAQYIKLGSNEIEEAAGLLRKIKEKISKNGGKPPKVLCVVCGICKAAYLRDDGVYVVPITALKD